MDQEEISLLPEGAKTPEGCERINKAMEAQYRTDAQCYQALQELFDAGQILIEQLTERHRKLIDPVEKCKEALSSRKEAYDELVQAVAGR